MSVVRLYRVRLGAGIADAQLVDQRGLQHLRVVEPRAMCRESRVLDAGDERSEVEARGRFGRRRQAAVGLSLRRVELELAVIEPHEERIGVRDAVIDPAGEGVVGDLAIGRRDVVVEITAAVVRERKDARDVQADAMESTRRNGVVGKLIPDSRGPARPAAWSADRKSG